MSLKILLKKFAETKNTDEKDQIRIEIVERHKVYPIMENLGICEKCGQYEDLRFGLCFDCANTKCPHDKCNLVQHVQQDDGTFKDFLGGFRFVCHGGKLDGRAYCFRPSGVCILKDGGKEE